MARYVLGTLGFGVKTTNEVQREAAVAVADGACLPGLMKLAGLGTAEHDEDAGYLRPTSSGNTERNLRRAVRIMTKGNISYLPTWEHDVAHASGQGANARMAHSYINGLVAPFADSMFVPLHACDTKFVSGAA